MSVLCRTVSLALLFLLTVDARAQVWLEQAFPHLTFETPVDLQHAGDGSNRIFVVERAGVVKAFDNDDQVGTASTFLDIRDRVYELLEEGLLGIAFHPDFADNGRFFVYYTASNPLRAVLAAYSAGSHAADPESEEILLEIAQPHVGHNGGQLRFGPDGYLYVAVGDGGGHDDALGTGEDLTNLLGTILRLDVDRSEDGMKYGIPEDNPFAGNDLGYREEIYAYGLRNPWRFSFDWESFIDPTTEVRLWVGDVGDGSYEEINLVEKGKNYGWSQMEGARCHARFPECSFEGRELPIWEYVHHADNGRSVIGGFPYRGTRLPHLLGEYLYGDYVSGRIWALSFSYEDDEYVVENRELLQDERFRIHSFGEDEFGELYVLGMHLDHGGVIYRLASDPVSPGYERDDLPRLFSLHGHFPNPFHESTTISYTLIQPASVELSVFDVLGRNVRTLVDGHQGPGLRTVTWHGRDASGRQISPGVYLYRLVANGAVVGSGTMLVLR